MLARSINIFKTALAVFLIATAYLVFKEGIGRGAEGDADRYMHLAIARMAAESGPPSAISQADNISWKDSYPNPYAFFHLLNGWLFRFGGFSLVLQGVSFFACLFLVLLFFVLQTRVSTGLACFLTLCALLTPAFAFRLVLLRPHLFVLSLFTLICFAVISRRFLLLTGTCALFAFSYSAVYMPMVVVLAGVLSSQREKKTALKVLGSGLLGFLIGMVCHPAFPKNLGMTLLTARNALNAAGIPIELRANEILPLGVVSLFSEYGFYLLALGFGAFVLMKQPSKDRRALATLFISSAVFWGVAVVSRRGLEYAVPSTLILLAFAIGRRPRAGVRVAVFGASLVLLAGPAFSKYRTPVKKVPMASTGEAVRALPDSGKGKKILNCVWDTSPYILFERPGYRFVDIADPVVLATESPSLHLLREEFRRGFVPNPHQVAREVFRSDYVLCEYPQANEQMERDPHFKRIHPERQDSYVTSLYEVVPNRLPGDVADFEVSGWYNQPSCLVIQPTDAEIQKHIGAEILWFSGRPGLELWRNGGHFHTARGSPANPSQVLTTAVRLPSPISRKDRIQVVVCGGKDWTTEFALSLWTQKDLREYCRQKAPDFYRLGMGTDPLKSCLGKIEPIVALMD